MIDQLITILESGLHVLWGLLYIFSLLTVYAAVLCLLALPVFLLFRSIYNRRNPFLVKGEK